MSSDLYLYSYPKQSVKPKVRTCWNLNKPVSHIDDVYGEVEGNAQVQEWWLKSICCQDALLFIAPTDETGSYDGDQEFSITKEQLIVFRQNIIDLDFKDEEKSEWILERLNDLQKLIDTFDFDNNYLTVHTD